MDDEEKILYWMREAKEAKHALWQMQQAQEAVSERTAEPTSVQAEPGAIIPQADGSAIWEQRFTIAAPATKAERTVEPTDAMFAAFNGVCNLLDRRDMEDIIRSILSLAANPGPAKEALIEVRRVLQAENEKGYRGAICDTIWYSNHETLFDYIDAALAAPATEPTDFKSADFGCVDQARRAASAKFDHYHEVMAPAGSAEREADMQRALQLARKFALIEGQREGKQHSYLPQRAEKLDEWEPHDWVIKAIMAAMPDDAAPATEPTARCPSCDGTGDLHNLNGEWLGRCHCVAGEPVLPPLPEARIESYQTDAVMRRYTLHTYSAEDMREYALSAIAANPPGAEDIRGAIARGWCYRLNSHKELDVDLVNAIAQEIAALLSSQGKKEGGQ